MPTPRQKQVAAGKAMVAKGKMRTPRKYRGKAKNDGKYRTQ